MHVLVIYRQMEAMLMVMEAFQGFEQKINVRRNSIHTYFYYITSAALFGVISIAVLYVILHLLIFIHKQIYDYRLRYIIEMIVLCH